MEKQKSWFAAHSRVLLRGVLIALGAAVGGYCLFIVGVQLLWMYQPPVSHRAALADLDNDGDLDAVLANGVNEGRSENTLWINQGGAQGGQAGLFTASDQRLGSAEYHNLATGDLDNDGDLDFLAGHTWDGIELFINQGGAQGKETGRFESALTLRAGEYWGGTHPTSLGDLDGDGDLDILSGNCCGGMMMRDNARDNAEPEPLPAYNAMWINQAAEGGAAQVTGVPVFRNAEVPVEELGGTEALALGDLDGDGDLDAFMAKAKEINGPGDEYHRRTAYRVWWNDGAGGFQPAERSLDGPNVRDLALGDLDGDGDLDALAGTVSGAQVILNQGGAQGGKVGQFAIQPGMLGKLLINAVFLGDLDGNGSPDALLGGWTEAQVWLNDSRGAFRQARGRLRFSNRSAVTLGDVDGDGDVDVFSARLAEHYRVWRNDGKGRFVLIEW